MNQKLIDTLLQINSRLSQNFDISNIISVANKVRKQPHERQHYEKKDTGLNNQQKQEENKSSEKSIEKNGSNKKKKKIDHQKNIASLPTEKSNKNIFILLGDSMAVVFRFFCQYSLVPPVFRCSTSVPLFLRCSVFRSSDAPGFIVCPKSIIDVAKSTQSHSRKVSISGIVPRNVNLNIKETEVNKKLSKMCDKEIAFYES